MRSRFFAVLLATSAAAAAAGCAARAKAMPESPPLEVPPPPPRDVELSGSEPPQPMPLPQEPARTATPHLRPAPPQSRPETAPPAEKPETMPPSTEPPPSPPEEAPKPPAPTLQTTPATAEREVERSVKATLTKANNDLSRIDYRVLNAEARTQYETAKSFIRQAESAIQARNLVFAKNLADKAAGLAAQLGAK